MAVLLLSLATVCSAWSQAGGVTVEIKLEQEQFLPDEDIRVAVHITNFSGQPIEFGQDNTWLTFFVESRDRHLFEKYSNPDVRGAFTLESSKTAIKRVNITPHYNISRPGRYEVSAKVFLEKWNVMISSRPVTFDIVRGSVLSEMPVGVPPLPGEENGPPETRKYILQQAEFRKEMKLYIRLTDATGEKTVKLFPIARMMSFAKPQMQVDKFSNLHVLHQSGQNSFTYCTMNPFGQIIARNRYDYQGDSRPRLGVNDEGRIVVRGGIRVASADDIPPSDIPVSAESNAP